MTWGGSLPASSLTASSVHSSFFGIPLGRLHSTNGWCPKEIANIGLDYLQVNLGALNRVCAVVTQGCKKRDNFVTEYRIDVSINGRDWEAVEENGLTKVSSEGVICVSINASGLNSPPVITTFVCLV